MDKTKPIAVLFDFDGVVMDTETQYTVFWNKIGKEYYPEMKDFGMIIKGMTLVQIYDKYFQGRTDDQRVITAGLTEFETKMSFNYIDGAVDFMRSLKEKGIRSAIITSSNLPKMANVYAAHPELKELVDRILTSENFTRSKPFPDCFLLGAEVLGTVPENCIVFEDSFHGLQAGNAAGMKVVGLSTTNPAEAIADKCSQVISDFTAYTCEDMLSLLE